MDFNEMIDSILVQLQEIATILQNIWNELSALFGTAEEV